MPGDIIRYDLTNISNASNVELEDFYVRDMIPTDALRLEKIVTGRWSERLTYRVEYRTNYKDWRTLKGNLSTQVSHTLDCGREALGLRADEVITQIRFRFGTVQPGFRDLDGIALYCTVKAGLPGGYRFTNCADAGGERDGEWTIEKDCWTTVAWDKPRGKLPQTGL